LTKDVANRLRVCGIYLMNKLNVYVLMRMYNEI